MTRAIIGRIKDQENYYINNNRKQQIEQKQKERESQILLQESQTTRSAKHKIKKPQYPKKDGNIPKHNSVQIIYQ